MRLTFDSVTLNNRVESISFSLLDGETLVLSGPSGAGKSTILSLAAGLSVPDSGSVQREGRFAYLFQESDLQIFENTVAAEVGFALKCQKLDKREVENRVRSAISQVGLDYDSYKDHTPYILSGGEKKRIALASLLVMEPELLFLDEPTAGLDGKSAKGFISVLKALKREGKTVVLATHDETLIAECADRVLTLEKGRMTALLSPKEYYEANPEVSLVSQLSKKLGYSGIYRFDDLIRKLGGENAEH